MSKKFKKTVKNNVRNLIIFLFEKSVFDGVMLTCILLASFGFTSYYLARFTKIILLLTRIYLFDGSSSMMWSTIVLCILLMVILIVFIKLQMMRLKRFHCQEGLLVREYIAIKAFQLVYMFTRIVSTKMANRMAKKLTAYCEDLRHRAVVRKHAFRKIYNYKKTERG